MIRRNNKGQEWEATCDECSSGNASRSFTESWNFYDFVSWLKEQGWRLFKDGDEWVHRCQTCVSTKPAKHRRTVR